LAIVPAVPRPSHIRIRVADLLATSERHDWTIDEIRDGLADGGQAADFSSVFRALQRLEADGGVRRVQLGDGKARFESVGEHHEHVVCERCGTVGEVPGCAVRAEVRERTDFVITGHELLFSGICPRCAGSASR
jgi:Fe2+ or Zn2+ uptake regulation protein